MHELKLPAIQQLLAGTRPELFQDDGATWALLPDQGLAHSHVRLGPSRRLLRIPKQSQLGLNAVDNLAHQAACFTRARPSGHTPEIFGVIEPNALLPQGALVVGFIEGRALAADADAKALGDCLAAIHQMPIPSLSERSPLRSEADPLVGLAREVRAQLLRADLESLPRAARAALSAAPTWFSRWSEVTERPAVSLIAFDAHPGNYRVAGAGVEERAFLVDLEKCRYSYSALDLAHATQYTSTTWDAASCVSLQPGQVDAVYAAWLAAMPHAQVQAQARWWGALRHAMWLWSLSWCAMWQTESTHPAAEQGEDWSASKSEASTITHVRERVAHYLSDAGVERVRDEFAALRSLWPQGVAWC